MNLIISASILLLLFLSFCAEIHGQIVNLGRCPRISGMRDFNISRVRFKFIFVCEFIG